MKELMLKDSERQLILENNERFCSSSYFVF